MTGNDIKIVLKQNGVALAATKIKSHEVNTQCEVIEKASSSTGVWKEYISGRKEWNVTISYIILAEGMTADVLRVGNSYDIEITSGNTSIGGSVILTSAKHVATRGNLAQGSYTLKGNGVLS